MTKKLTVIKRSKPECPVCDAQVAELDKYGIDYELKDVTKDFTLIKKHDIKAIPVLLISDNDSVVERFDGFTPVSTIKEVLKGGN